MALSVLSSSGGGGDAESIFLKYDIDNASYTITEEGNVTTSIGRTSDADVTIVMTDDQVVKTVTPFEGDYKYIQTVNITDSSYTSSYVEVPKN